MSSHSSCYAVPAESFKTEYEVKKSQFIALAHYATSRDSAMELLTKAREDYPDARHHCWAYLIGPPNAPVTVAMSDDGEPSGTAGKPILNILQHKDVGDIMLIVVRYFGGIKLGAGGLVRAYSQAAQLAVDALPRREHRELHQLTIESDFATEQAVRHWLDLRGGKVEQIAYSTNVKYSVAFDHADLDTFQAWAEANHVVVMDSPAKGLK